MAASHGSGYHWYFLAGCYVRGSVNGSFLAKNLFRIEQPGVPGKAQSPPSTSLLLPVSFVLGEAWAGQATPVLVPEQQVWEVRRQEPARAWPFTNLDAPHLSLGAELATICEVTPGPRHLLQLLIKGKINRPWPGGTSPSAWLWLGGAARLRGMVARGEEACPDGDTGRRHQAIWRAGPAPRLAGQLG